MAITKIWPIKSTPNLAIDYIIDDKKTRYKTLISSHKVAPKTAAFEFAITRGFAGKDNKILAHHLVQAFKRGETTPEQAHEIGIRLAEEVFKGKYEYVLSTHVDKGHIHNHIIINSVSFDDYSKYQGNTKNYWDIRKANDRLCHEYNLSVPEGTKKSRGKKVGVIKSEEKSEAGDTSYKKMLQKNIDECLVDAKSFDDLLLRMEQTYGYEVKRGKYIAFKAQGQTKYTRVKSLGAYYTEDTLKQRIEGQKNKLLKVNDNTYTGNTNVIKNNTKKPQTVEEWLMIRSKKRAAYLNKYKQTNDIQETANQIAFLRQKGIKTPNDFAAFKQRITETITNDRTKYEDAHTSFLQLQVLAKNIVVCGKYGELYKNYLQSQNRDDFEKRSPEVILYRQAAATLRENGIVEQSQLAEIVDKYNQTKQKLIELKTSIGENQRLMDIVKSIEVSTDREEDDKKTGKVQR